MTSPLELSSRAALCRQLAMREPGSRALWMAEAENWSRLAQRPCNTGVTRRGDSTGCCHWSILRNRNWLRLNGTGGYSQSLRQGGGAWKDPFEDFMDLMAIEDSE
jgi:hypothetical protein